MEQQRIAWFWCGGVGADLLIAFTWAVDRCRSSTCYFSRIATTTALD